MPMKVEENTHSPNQEKKVFFNHSQQPVSEPTAEPQVEHAYKEEPEAPKQAKTVGNMEEEEFLSLLIKGVIQADRVRDQLNDKKQREFDSNRTPVQKSLGVVGDTCHGVVDIFEGTIRGVIDIATFGQSKGR